MGRSWPTLVQLIAAAGQRAAGGHGRDEVRKVERGQSESQPGTRLQQRGGREGLGVVGECAALHSPIVLVVASVSAALGADEAGHPERPLLDASTSGRTATHI